MKPIMLTRPVDGARGLRISPLALTSWGPIPDAGSGSTGGSAVTLGALTFHVRETPEEIDALFDDATSGAG